MSPVLIALIAINSFLFGWMVSWVTFDKVFYEPQRKLLRDTLEGWGHTIDLLSKSLGIMPKNADGSMISPIQVKKEE